jgi:hypothetical protein
MNMPAEHQPDIHDLAVEAIDQVVIDGLVDGAERRVKIGTLLRISLGGDALSDSDFKEYHRSLLTEPRYVNRVGNSWGFEPTIRPESSAKPSLIAIVGGTALCGERERLQAKALMNHFAETVYNGENLAGGILSIREVRGVLNSGGIDEPTYQEFGAFLGYMWQD